MHNFAVRKIQFVGLRLCEWLAVVVFPVNLMAAKEFRELVIAS